MDNWSSIRYCSRARTSERGFALAMALIIATLYFGLIGLMMVDASRELAEARRFRARIVALTLAENGAERAAHMMVGGSPILTIDEKDWQGTIVGRREQKGATFRIFATATATGVVEAKAGVEVDGVIVGNTVRIDYTRHTQ